MRAAAAVGALLIGCGGAPTPAAPSGPRCYAQLAPANVEPVDLKRPTKRFVVSFTADALPDADALEAALAKSNQVASIGETSTTLDVELLGAVCEVVVGDPLPNRPDPAIQPELDRNGLSEAEGRAIFESTRTGRLSCQADDPPVHTAATAAEALALALVRATDGHLYDPHLDRFWPLADWEALGRRGFSVERHVRVVRERGDDGAWWLGTRGMEALGRADLELFPVPDARVDAAAEALLVLADGIVQYEPVGDGSTLRSGGVDLLLIGRERFAATLPSGVAGTDVTPPSGAVLRLAIVDPKAAPGDRTAVERLARRLTLE